MKEVEVEIKKQESESNEIAQWKELYQEVKAENRRLSEKVDELYKQQHTLTNQLLVLQATIKDYSCTRAGCKNREHLDCPISTIKTAKKDKGN